MPDSINKQNNASQVNATAVPSVESENKPRMEQVTTQRTKKTRDRSRLQIRRLTQGAVLIALALVLSIIERWIPLDLIVPIPGIKLGLANIVTLFALLRLSPLDAAIILVVRSLIMGLITGPSTLMFSLAGGTLALLVMWFLSRWEGKAFSMIGISLAGAAAHNIGQISVAVLLLSEPLLLMMYLPPLLLASMVTGTLTGIAAFPIAARFAKPQPVKTERAN
jgi:heptaprenyl diphosphate synthase